MYLLVDKKISDAQVAAGETFAGINYEIAALKKGKGVIDGTYFPDPSSATTPPASDPFYGMPPNSFPGQTPPPLSVHAPPAGSVCATGQTGVMVHSSPCPTPPATIPGSAAPSRTNEVVP